MTKSEVYKRIKIAGFLSFIPLILAAGPLSGYVVGDFLQKKFGLGNYVFYGCIGIGFLAGVMETVRIIRLVLKIDKA